MLGANSTVRWAPRPELGAELWISARGQEVCECQEWQLVRGSIPPFSCRVSEADSTGVALINLPDLSHGAPLPMALQEESSTAQQS